MRHVLDRTATRFATAVDRPLQRYAIAGLSVAAAAGVRLATGLITDHPTSFPPFFVAVLIAVVLGGVGPGLIAVIASALLVWGLWLPSPGQWPLSPDSAVQLVTFVLCAAVIVLLVGALRVAVRQGLAAEQRFRRAREASLDAFVILEPVRRGGGVIDFRWTYANPAAEALRPSGVSSLIGRRVTEAFPNDTGTTMRDRLSRLLEEGGPDDMELRRVIDGVEHWVRSSGVRLGEGVAVTFRDITRERQAAEALRTSEEQFRGVANAAPVLIWISDVDGACVWFNDAWLKFRGRTLAQERGRGWAEGVHPDDLGPGLDEVDAAVRARAPFHVTYRLRRADGAWRWINSAGAARYDTYGQFQGYVGSCLDFTEVVETRQDLEARVAERTAALEASNAEKAATEAALAQSQRLETVGRLTGGMAHDFNNLLTVIVGGLDMILRHPEDLARVRRLGEAALAAGQRGERLTRQLLAFSRSQELKLETVDLPGLVLQIEPLIRRAAGEAITLTVRADPAAGAARVDPAQFEAALLNLVVNAVDATPPGGEITVEVAAERLADGEVGAARAGDYVRVAVSDTGHGMSPLVLSRVFEPFFTTKEVGKGTGLGLAQVYGFMRQCGGAVTIDSVEGQGATVTLHLPATTIPAELAPAVAAEDHTALAGARVLLVEDDPEVRALTEGLLAEFGCVVTIAENGAKALEQLETAGRFDAMVSDIVMPGGISGVDLARLAAEREPRLAILLTTGYAGDRLSVAAADLAWPVLRKPFRIEQLASALTGVLRRDPPAKRRRKTTAAASVRPAPRA